MLINLKTYLKKRGLLKLHPRILRGLIEKVQNSEKSEVPKVILARSSDQERYKDAISETLGLVVVHDRLNNAAKQETPVTVVIAMSEANRDLLQNAIPGSIIFNEDSDRFNFKQASGWVTFTPVPA